MAAANRGLSVRTVLAGYIVKNALTDLNPAGHGHFENRGFRGFFLIFKVKTKSDDTLFWRIFLARSGRVRYITSECACAET